MICRNLVLRAFNTSKADAMLSSASPSCPAPFQCSTTSLTGLFHSRRSISTVTDSINLLQLQCSLFSTTFNPTNARLGNKVLRQRLKGPTLAAYYPRKSATVEDIQKEFAKLDLVTWNEQEEDRLEGLQIAKLRGKGAPKKKRTADGEFGLSHISMRPRCGR
jgi:small subunit ribosomal protein S33